LTELFGSTRLPYSSRRPVAAQLSALAMAATSVVTGHAQRAPDAAPEPRIETQSQSAGGAQRGASPGGQSTTTAGWSDGFVVQSATGDYRLQIGLLLQADGRFSLDDESEVVVDTFGIRRLRPYLRGRVAQHFEFYVNPDFANGTLVVGSPPVASGLSPTADRRLETTSVTTPPGGSGWAAGTSGSSLCAENDCTAATLAKDVVGAGA